MTDGKARAYQPKGPSAFDRCLLAASLMCLIAAFGLKLVDHDARHPAGVSFPALRGPMAEPR